MQNNSNTEYSGYDESIPHHILWVHHEGKLPEYVKHLYYCKCQDCKKARFTYIHSKAPYSGYDERIPHHLLWDHHNGKFPDYLNQLHKCLCLDCDNARDKYTY